MLPPHPNQIMVGVVTLIGPPGSGKSLMGAALKAAHPEAVLQFLSVGEELRREGLVEQMQAHPSTDLGQRMRARARELLTAGVSALKAATAAGTSGPR